MSTNGDTCQVCIPGFTIVMSQSKFCSACPKGYYKSEYGIADCLPCPKGWSTFGLQGQVSCRPCLEGTSTNGLTGQSICSTCLEFSEAVEMGSSICKCVNGTSLDYTGNRCIMCTPGNYNFYSSVLLPESQDRCFSCDFGTYSSHQGSTFCQTCPPGTFNPIKSATHCILCEINSHNPYWGQSQCIKCENNSYTSFTGSNNVSCTCAAGTEIYSGDSNIRCILCPPGKYQPFNNTFNSFDVVCKDCEPGTYSTNTASSSCDLCSSNQYETKWGSTSCLECKQYSIVTLSENGQPSCDCIPGTSNNFDNTKCIPCPIGFFQSQYNSDQCLKCPLFSTTVREGSSLPGNCTYCSPGSSLFYNLSVDPSVPMCLPCKPGFYQPNSGTKNLCVSCPPGSYSDLYASTDCKLCDPNTYSENGGSSTCSKCPLYSENNEYGSISCKCIIGTSENQSNHNSCIPCPPGSYQPLNSTSCTLCEPGSYSLLSMTMSNCTLCPINTFSSVSGATECLNCENYSETNGIGKSNCNCILGTTPDQNGKCMPCIPGSYQPFLGSNYCKLCEPGSYSPLSGTMYNCTQCPINTFSSVSGATKCLNCENYSETNGIGKSNCNCILGTTPDQNGKCMPCIPGSYQPFLGSNYCKLCEPGSYSSLSGTANNCTQCPINTFSSVSGATECLNCENYSETIGLGYSNCSCILGTTSNQDGKCMPCIPGSYQPFLNSTYCRLCEQGSYTSLSGTMYNCTQCPINTFSSMSGSTICMDCKIYSETLKVGSSQCECMLGTNLNYLGTDCIPCIPGTFQRDKLSGSCSPCPIGTYSIKSSSSTCIDCPIGSFNIKLGSTSCTQCLENSIFSIQQSKCICDIGTYNLTMRVIPNSTYNISNNNTNDLDNTTYIHNDSFNDKTYTNNSYWQCTKCKENCTENYYYISKQCTSDSDIICSPCKSTCPIGTYLKQNCTNNQDTICKACASTCIRGYYIKSKCTNISNLVCEECMIQCPSGHIRQSPCTSEKNMVCVKCPMGKYAQSSGTAPSTVCIECLPGYITSNLQDYCIKCDEGWYTNANKTLCVRQCPAGSYPSNVNTCSLCPKYSYGVDGFSCITCMGCGSEVLLEGATSCSTCNIQDINDNNTISNVCKIQ